MLFSAAVKIPAGAHRQFI